MSESSKTNKNIFNEEELLSVSKINTTQIVKELSETPSWIAFYGARLAYWNQQVDLKKLNREVIYSNLINDLKTTSKGTDKSREAEAKSTEQWKAACRALAYAEHQLLCFKHAVAAMQSKHISLTCINSNQKYEQSNTRASNYIDSSHQENMSRILDAQS